MKKKKKTTTTTSAKLKKTHKGELAGPKRGSLNVGSMTCARKRQESATFLQRSFFNIAVQFFVCCSVAFGKNDVHTTEKRMLQRNFPKIAAQLVFFRLWHVVGVGLSGVGFRTVTC